MHPQCQSAEHLRIPEAILVVFGGGILRPHVLKTQKGGPHK